MATVTNTKYFTMVWTSQGNKTLRLAPGMGEIDGEDLRALLKHPVFNDYVKRGWIKIMEDITEYQEVTKPVIEEKEEEKTEDSKYVSIRELIAIIEKTTDKEQLKKYAEDSRRKVSEAAKLQLSTLE